MNGPLLLKINSSFSSLYVLCVLCGVGHVACGQKGAPLAPIVYLPVPVTELKAKRVEGDIVLEFKVPAVNTDGSGPADLDRLEVYAHTGPLPTPADYLKYGTLVQSIPIKQPPAPAGTEGQMAEGKGQTAEGASSADLQVGQSSGTQLLEQGAATTVREALTEKHMEIGPMPPTRAALPVVTTVQIQTLETPETVNFPLPPVRYYTIFGVSESRDRRGPHAGPIRVPLVSPLVAPAKLDATYTATAISLSWPGQPEDAVVPAQAAAAVAVEAPAIEGSNLETAGTREIYAGVETEGTVNAPWAGAAPTSKPQPPPTARFGYNVYEASAFLAPIAPIAPDAPVAPVAPLNAALLTTPAFTDARVEFGTERCYVVRRVEMAGTVAIESAPSAVTCVKPVDTFPPEPPKMLQSVASGTTVNLIWEASTEADLAGYVILRGEAPGEKLAPLTPAPITDASYVDSSVRRARTYVYEILAVDTAGNQSGPSNRVEDTIR